MDLGSITAAAPLGRIRDAIQSAASRTGIAFDYLFRQAEVESGLNPAARARTSSAAGLFQFIDSTWLSVLKRHGAKHGLGWAAECISGEGGSACVRDPAKRRAVMALKNDPAVASLMAGEFAADNRATLEARLGRPASATDLYLAHFLGAGGATTFLSAMATDGGQAAAALMPAAARANRAIFYDAAGSARTLDQVHARFAAKFGELGSPASNAVPAAGEARDGVPLQLAGGAADALVRPGPQMARMAYLMLAEFGG